MVRAAQRTVLVLFTASIAFSILGMVLLESAPAVIAWAAGSLVSRTAEPPSTP